MSIDLLHNCQTYRSINPDKEEIKQYNILKNKLDTYTNNNNQLIETLNTLCEEAKSAVYRGKNVTLSIGTVSISKTNAKCFIITVGE